MKNRPLVYVTVAYGVGILFSAWQPLPLGFWFFCLISLLVLWLISNWKKAFLGWLLLIAFFCLGAGYYELKNSRQTELLAELPLGRELEIVGEVLAGPFVYPNRTNYEIRLQNGAKVQLRIRGENLEDSYQPRDQIVVKGVLERPKEARNPGEFDYRAYLWRQGFVAEITSSPQKVRLIKETGKYNWQGLLLGAKSRFTQALEDNMSLKASAIARALVFGDKTALEQDLKNLFLALGVMHLLAVSGLHVGFLLLLVYIMRRLLGLGPRRGFIFTVVLLVAYAALTDFTSSVLRASLMALVVLLGDLLRKEKDFYTSLAGAGLILLLHNPFNLFQSGFQMSFLAAWGIVYFRPLIGIFLPKRLRWREVIMVPLAAQVAVLPATAYYFNLISLVGLVVNLLLVPVAGFIVIGGLVAFMISLFSASLTSLFLVSLGGLIDLLILVLIPIGNLPWSAISVATPSGILAFFYYLALVGLKELMNQDHWQEKVKDCRNLLIVFLLIAFSLILGWKQFYIPPLEVVFLDVGQGDAIFLRTPKGQTILVDGGGAPRWQEGGFRVGRETVVPYLERRGIKEVDFLISSHPDSDHLQGLEDMLLELGAKAILMPPKNLFSGDYDGLIELANFRQVPIAEVVAGDKLYLDHGIILEILNPPKYKPSYTTASDNNHSLLIQVSYGSASFLLTGDLEVEALKYLFETGQTGLGTVFKAPHHGSRTGFYEPYLEELEPLAVVLSVGRNSYGHPAQDLIDYWEKRGVALYRTDHQGAIQIFTDGKKLNIKPFITKDNW